jgi:hypothetical protein
MFKKFISIALLATVVLVSASLAETLEFPSGSSIIVTLDPSPDPRAAGHNLYYKNEITGDETRIDLKTQASHQIPAGTFVEGVVYKLTATAYGQVNGQDSESDRCEAVYAKIKKPVTQDELTGAYEETFETFGAGADPPDWYDTKAGNSMEEDGSLFKVFEAGGSKAFGTTSILDNIHSHNIKTYVKNLVLVEYTGRMMIANQKGGIGITFLSHYPLTDNYYRIRRDQWNPAFHIAPHPHGKIAVSGVTNSGVAPEAGQWYRFRILARNTGVATTIQAKTWKEAEAEPTTWQIDAYDNSPGRFVSGTVGVWSGGAGAKYWDDLKVVSVEEKDLATPAINNVQAQ